MGYGHDPNHYKSGIYNDHSGGVRPRHYFGLLNKFRHALLTIALYLGHDQESDRSYAVD
jgi:hypothetical protein